MKLYTINPLYTSFFSVIIFATLTYSISLFSINGKTYLNSKYEVVFGGNKTLRIGENSFPGMKIYRKLPVDEQLKVKEMKKKMDIQREKERKERDEAREREQKLRDADREQLKKERKILEARGGYYKGFDAEHEPRGSYYKGFDAEREPRGTYYKGFDSERAGRGRYYRGFDSEREAGNYNVKWKYR